MSTTEHVLGPSIARSIHELRLAVGWTQAQLGQRAGVSRSLVAMTEGGRGNPSIRVVARLFDALGARADLTVQAPFLVDRRRQREPAHARSIAFVQRRLERMGWVTAREVEIAHGRSHGWMDLLAFHTHRGALLVSEVKTDLEDLGRVERTVSWYEREAWRAARQRGWRPRLCVASLLLLDTDRMHDRLADNRHSLDRAFPGRSKALTTWLSDPATPWRTPARAVALIDPLSRRVDWLRGLRADGRRTSAPYADYADFMRCVRSGRRSQ